MIPSSILEPDAHGRQAFDIQALCRECGVDLRFTRIDDRVECTVPGMRATRSDDDRVWATLRLLACDCGQLSRRWRFAPAIPSVATLDDDELAARRSTWQDAGQTDLAYWGAPINSLWPIRNAPTSLHAYAMLTLGIHTKATLKRFQPGGDDNVLDLLEWVRAGIDDPALPAKWRRAGARDAHDVACRTRAGETPATIDTSRNGCQVLADEWPTTKPATTECARRLRVNSGAAIARLVVAVPSGSRIEIFESTHHEQPVIVANRVIIDHPNHPTLAAAA